MAKRPNIYALLKTAEAFVKSVPLDRKAPNYKDWIKNRAETKKAIREIYKILSRLEMHEARDFVYPCGRIPQKQIIDWLLPCRKVLLKYVEPGFIRICGRVLTKQIAEQFKTPPDIE